MPALWGYARDLFQTPGFGDNTDFDQIKQHYYVVHADINPTGIVPQGRTRRSGWSRTAAITFSPVRRRTGAVGGGCRSSAAVPRTSGASG